MSDRLIKLQCCCCGSSTYGRQWWNRDKGFGLCPTCADMLQNKETPENMMSYYGINGTHYYTTSMLRFRGK